MKQRALKLSGYTWKRETEEIKVRTWSWKQQRKRMVTAEKGENFLI